MKINRVKQAKRKTWWTLLMSIGLFIITYICMYMFLPTADLTSTEYLFFNFTCIMTATVTSVLFFYARLDFIWRKLKILKSTHNSERLMNHYNLCLRLMEEKNYQRALQIYNKVFGKSNQPVAHIIRVALKVAHNQTLKDEIITLENLS